MDLNLVACGAGMLAIAHRPRLKDMPRLEAQGVTHVVTLLAEREGAKQIGDATMAAGLEWIWVPFPNAAVPDESRDAECLAALHAVREVVVQGGKALIHCSAGIHRTGMFTYALLRQLGQASEPALSTLRMLRPLTAEGVGENRIVWGERLARMNSI